MWGHQVRSYGPPVTTKDPAPEPATGPAPVDTTGIPSYEIRVRGHLGPRWSAWFEGMRLTAEPDGTTAIQGPVVDQAALHGLLQKLRDLGIPLVSVRPISGPPLTS